MGYLRGARGALLRPLLTSRVSWEARYKIKIAIGNSKTRGAVLELLYGRKCLKFVLAYTSSGSRGSFFYMKGVLASFANQRWGSVERLHPERGLGYKRAASRTQSVLASVLNKAMAFTSQKAHRTHQSTTQR